MYHIKQQMFFCNKNLFKKLLEENEINKPKSKTLSSDSMYEDILNLKFQVIIKPTDCIKEVSRLVKVSSVINGAFNIEKVITKDNKLFFLNAGPRNGGNMLPEFMG